MPLHQTLIYILLAFLLTSCTVIERYRLDVQYGPSNVDNRHQSIQSAASEIKKQNDIEYYKDVKPILDSRCVVCHGCYDAPCQLKLSSIEGLERGASKQKVYNAARLRAAQPSRLFEDAETVRQWREQGFFPVLNDREQTVAANLDASVMARLLMLKYEHPLPDITPLPDSFDFSLYNANHCVRMEEFAGFAQNKPLWGMPYGLPNLPEKEYQTLIQWLAQGAVYQKETKISEPELALIRHWEQFLNGDSLKHRLMSRYLFEHLFVARLYFSYVDTKKSPQHYYRLVRSSTPPGEPVIRIATRRPYDDPGVTRVYYRLIQEPVTTVVKTHMPYRLDEQRMQRYHNLFIEADYKVSELPGYELASASNPFITFTQIPEKSRYQFMLDEAEFTIMGFIKGPVCRGQIALNVIQDHFWVFFVNPELELKVYQSGFLLKNLKGMHLPARDSSSALIVNWLKYAKEQENFLKAKSQLLEQETQILNIDSIWDGDQKNHNAALTVFRHFDSASVVKGLVGEKPKTAWVIDYSLLERIHYLLVAGFDVYGNYAHQLNTRLYMDFLRLEGEFNFLALLPERSRIRVRDEWYERATNTVKNHLYGRYAYLGNESAIHYQTDDHKNELFDLLRSHLGNAVNRSYDLSDSGAQNDIETQLKSLERLKGKGIVQLPQVSFLMINDDEETRAYSLIHNNAHLNISHLFNEGSERISEEDTITVAKGFIGSYPNSFLSVKKEQLPRLVRLLTDMRTEKDYQSLLDQFGVRRNDPRFWHFSDRVHALFKQSQPLKSGIFDYNRLENR